MDFGYNWNHEDRENRLELTHAVQDEKRQGKKRKGIINLKLALNELMRQIKLAILIIVIVSLGILMLCASAWYILKLEEENKTIIPEISFIKESKNINDTLIKHIYC